MANYTVNFVIRDWVEVNVDAKDESEAKEKAEKIVNNCYKKDIITVDGKTEYVGVTNLSIINEVLED